MIAASQDSQILRLFFPDLSDLRRGFGNMLLGSIYAMPCKNSHFHADDGKLPMALDEDDVVLTEMTLPTLLIQFCAPSNSAPPASTRN